MLYGYQQSHVDTLYAAILDNNVCVDMSDTGTGKTYCALALAKKLGYNVFIVAPKAALPNWFAVAEKFGFKKTMQSMKDSVEGDEHGDGLLIGAANYEMLRNMKYYTNMHDFMANAPSKCPYIDISKMETKKRSEPVINWIIPDYTLVIFDEAHRGKNRRTTTAGMISSMRRSIGPTIKTLLLSATINDRIENMDVLAYMLGWYKPFDSATYRRWIKSFAFVNNCVDDASLVAAFRQKMLPDYGSRMTLHAKVVNDVKAEMYVVDDKSAAEIERGHQDMQHALWEMRNGGNAIGQIITAWQNIEFAKARAIIPKIREALDDEPHGAPVRARTSVIVFVNFINTMNTIAEQFRCSLIHGKQTVKEREAAISAFQSGKVRLIIAQMKAGGTCLNLQDQVGDRPRYTFIFPTWSGTDFKQSLGRAYRVDSASNVVQRVVYCTNMNNGGIEATLCELLNKKLAHIDMLNDGGILKTAIERDLPIEYDEHCENVCM